MRSQTQDTEYLQRYFRDLSRSACRPNNRADEFALCQRMKSGDKRAEDQLIKASMRFVVTVARQYMHQGVALEDLIQVGNKGLVKAARRFDGSKNFRFVSYAVWWIRQEILIAISEQSRGLRLNGCRTARYVFISKTIELFEQKHQRQPTIAEISDLTGLPEKAVQLSMHSTISWVSLNAPVGNGTEELTDHILDEMEPEYIPPSKDLYKAINSLPKRELFIIRLYYGFEDNFCYTSEEVGYRIGISRERVRQLRERALKRMKIRLRAA